MKFGIVGGLGPASTLTYYREIVKQYIAAKKTYPSLALESVPMDVFCSRMDEKQEEAAAQQILEAIRCLHQGGANAAAIASNTPHVLWERLIAKSPLPLVSIVDETCHWVAAHHFERVLILGTAFTMQNGLYERGLRHVGVTAFTPEPPDQKRIQNIIFPNLENGVILPEDRSAVIELCEKYIKVSRLDAVILGCTELPLMIQPEDVSVPIADTTQIHIDTIAKLMIQVEAPLECPKQTATDAFSSPFASVCFLPLEQAVKLTWHQFAQGVDYRRPTRFALELLRQHPGATFYVDARHGFEDDIGDVAWGFSYLLPEMAKSGCKTVIFRLSEVRKDLDGEMDLWTAEFARYFRVIRVATEEEVQNALRNDL